MRAVSESQSEKFSSIHNTVQHYTTWMHAFFFHPVKYFDTAVIFTQNTGTALIIQKQPSECEKYT